MPSPTGPVRCLCHAVALLWIASAGLCSRVQWPRSSYHEALCPLSGSIPFIVSGVACSGLSSRLKMLRFSGVKVGPTGCGDTLPTDYRANGRVRRLEQGFRQYDLRTTAAFTNTTSAHLVRYHDLRSQEPASEQSKSRVQPWPQKILPNRRSLRSTFCRVLLLF